MNYNWNWGVLWEASPEGVGTYFDTLLLGLRWTLYTAAVAWMIAFTIGSLIGIMRTTRYRGLVAVGDAYVELFRNIPILVQLFLWYFVLPEVLPGAAGLWLKQLPNSPFWTACVGLGLFMSARVAEQVKAGIQSLPKGQAMAGTALGFTPAQTYRYVLLPRAYRIIIPPLTSEMLNTVKNTSVALTIGLMEPTARTRAMQEFTFQVFEAFTVATILYLAVNILITLVMGRVERHFELPGQMGAVMLSEFDFDVIARTWPYLLGGLKFTLMLTLLASVFGLLLGLVLALMRLSSIRIVSGAATLYVNFIRSLPLVLVIFWFYFLVPYIGQFVTGAERPVEVGAFASALITFTMFEAVYFSEIFRAGIRLISRGQAAAGTALGFTPAQTMRYVVLPQAVRNMLPLMLTQTIILFQDTSLVYVILITDFLGAASTVAVRDGKMVEMYIVAAVVYFAISFAASQFVKQLRKRTAVA